MYTRRYFLKFSGHCVLLLCGLLLSTSVSYARYVGPFDDEFSLTAKEQRLQNNVSFGLILGLNSTQVGMIPIGFIPEPTVSYPAEIIGLAADISLKFTKAVLVAPEDKALSPNSADQCSYDFTLPQSEVTFDNFLGFWPKIGDDRLFLPNDDNIDFGILGVPEIAHANTEVLLSVFSFTGGAARQEGSQEVSMPAGYHSFEWRAETLVYPWWDIYIPTATTAVMMGMELKFASKIKKLKGLIGKNHRSASVVGGELVSAKGSKAMLETLDALNRRLKIYKRLKGIKDIGDDLNSVAEPLIGEFLIEQFFTGKKTVSRARNQGVTVYDVFPPVISTTSPTIDFEASDFGGTHLSRHFEKFFKSVTAEDSCGRSVILKHDAPEFLPLGETIVTWTVQDAGPAEPGIDHDADGIVDDDTVYTRKLTQVVTVKDTQAPLMVPPPGMVFESGSAVDLATKNLGQPLVVDLADNHPDVSSSDNTGGIVDVDHRTIVTWTATDHATVPNESTAQQLITVKSLGSNTAPTVTAETADTLTSIPVDIVLTGVDTDMLPLTGAAPGDPDVADPLQFKIEVPPQNGEFIAPLLPFFIDDYRTDKVGGLIDYINAQPDPPTLQASYELAVSTKKLAAWLEDQFCKDPVAAVAPVDFIFEPLYVHVTDDGEQYFFDHYLVCDPNGTDSPPQNVSHAVHFRISRWNKNNIFQGHVRIDDNGGGGISNNRAVFRIDDEDYVYYVDNLNGGEPSLAVQRCLANFTDKSIQPPNCQQQGFGPIDAGDTSDNGSDPESAFVDIKRELVFVPSGKRVDVYNYRREEPDNPLNPTRRQGLIGSLQNDAPVKDFLDDDSCNNAGGVRFNYSMEVDSKGNFYISDNACDRIHKFTPSYFDEQGNIVFGDYVGWAGKCTGSNNLACDVANKRTKGFSCTAAANCTVTGNNVSGALVGQFSNLSYLVFDPNDILYVADYGNSRIQRFATDGTFAGQAASTGNGINASTEGGFVLGNMGPPKNVSVNSKNFYVVDQSEKFVHVFDASPFKDITDSSATVTYVSEFSFYSDTDTFSYSVNDGLVDSNIAQVSINVERNYRQPLPTPQIVAVREDDSVVIILSGSDPDGIIGRDFNPLDSLTFSITKQPDSGTLTPGGDTGNLPLDDGTQVWTYTPGPDFFGRDVLSFTVRDAFTYATSDGATTIPETYGEAKPVDVVINVASVNDIPIVLITPPEKVAAGFPMLLQATAFDDIGSDYAASVFWGDGQQDQNGEIIFDDNGTPNDETDDSSRMTGIIFSVDGLNNIGESPMNAMHVFDSTGNRTVRVCMRDTGRLESCDELDIVVEELVAMGTRITFSDDEIVDGINFDASIEVLNAAPMNGVTGLPADNVILSMEIPDGIVIDSFSTPLGSCSISQNLFECNLGTMVNAANVMIDLVMRGSGVMIRDLQFDLTAEVRTDTAALQDVIASLASINIAAVKLDRDNDGLPNIFEAVYGVSDPDADDDTDGLINKQEFDAGTSPISSDTDQDGISDADELAIYLTDPLVEDIDNDGLSDGDEVNIYATNPASSDSDGDGLPDNWEINNGFNPIVNDSGGDADLDGLSDKDEFAYGTDHNIPDTDSDNLLDGEEVHTYLTDPTLADTDDDGLNDDAELVVGTDQNKQDSDDDGLLDGVEVNTTATQPLVSDTDRDGLPDGFEFLNSRSPNLPDYRLAAGGLSSCALTDEGVECWGRNDFNQAPPLVPNLADPKQVTVGYVHACAIDNEPGGRVVKCWGQNNFNQISPVVLVDPIQIAAGGYHTCALDRENVNLVTVKCWGRNNHGQRDNTPAGLEQPVKLVSSISGSSSCVLDNKATGPELVCWGQYNNVNAAIPASLGNDITALALGSEHGCIVEAGQQLCWGLNDDEQAPTGPIPGPAVELSLGGFHSCALRALDLNSYTANCWGLNNDGQSDVPLTLKQPLNLASGSRHSCALDEGSAKCWGVENNFDEGQAPAIRTLGIDPDNDGVFTADEITAGTNPLDPDTDRDQIDDATEAVLGTDPVDADSDDDGINDGAEVNTYATNPLDADTDGDGMTDKWEIDFGLQPAVNDADEDSDNDGVTNRVEFVNNIDPHRTDTDDDGIDDAAELAVYYYKDSGQSLGSLASKAVELGDIDNDGDLDAVVANTDGPNNIWLNDGAGVFSVVAGALNSIAARDVELGDIDEDDDLDIILAHPDLNESNTVWINGKGAAPLGVFTDSGVDLGQAESYSVRLGNFENHGVGLFSANTGADSVHVFSEDTWQQVNINNAFAGDSVDAAVGNLDGDSIDELFVVNRYQRIQVYKLSNTFPVYLEDINSQSGSINERSSAVELGDLDGDGDLDAYEVIFSAGDRIWINNGSGYFDIDLSKQQTGSDNGRDVGLLDVDNDGDLDAFVANKGANKLWLNDGSGVMTDTGTLMGIATSRGVGIGDVDGDGVEDAFIANEGANTVWLLKRLNPGESDTDGDGVFDGWEMANGFDPLDDSDVASDNDTDGLLAWQEFDAGTDPDNADSDGDGMPDGWEQDNGLDPTVDDSALDLDRDGADNLAEYQSGGAVQADDVPPVLITPADVMADAIGALTNVALGTASAIDERDGAVTAVVDNVGPYTPGAHTVTWSAADLSGNLAQETQSVGVVPLVNFAVDQFADEGGAVMVQLELNGTAVSYPVQVNYTVSGLATSPDDHDLADGSVMINSGTSGSISINIADDGFFEGPETFTLSIASAVNAVPGAQNSHTVTITQANVMPVANIIAEQQGKVVTTATADGGPITITAQVIDPNTADSHSFDWSNSDSVILNPADASDNSYTIDPSLLNSGLYRLVVDISDDGIPVATNQSETVLKIIATSPFLSPDIDSDNDGVNDATEGAADSDNDGIADYLDAFSTSNVLEYTADGYVLQTLTGLSLRLGEIAFSQGSYAGVTEAAVLEEIPYGYPNKVASVEIHGVEPATSALIVVPLHHPISAGAVFRNYTAGLWGDFVTDDKNQISSAPGSSGACPAAGDGSYVSGVNAGHGCIQLLLEDGGVNDVDGQVNGVVRAVAGLAVPVAASLEILPLSDKTVAKGSSNIVMLALRLNSDSGDTELKALTLKASGNGDDSGIRDVRLYVDNNGNGVVDEGEPSIASGLFSQDDDTFDLQMTSPYMIPAGQTNLLVTYDF